MFIWSCFSTCVSVPLDTKDKRLALNLGYVMRQGEMQTKRQDGP